MEILLLLILTLVGLTFKSLGFEMKRQHRRDYYRGNYLKSDAWQRKRYVVLKRDNWCCVYCGAHATQVHHKRYAKKNIGKEPIEWLVSICKSCHDSIHR
jgi:5-methylcytosine-specific restriction endonuclease McrA